MAGELHIGNDQFQYIARISHGKDSLKMLDVIVSRGLRLDRITTTDIWATDTIRGEHPKMVKFKEIADEFIWRKYRIEVEHLCAMRNGQKVTYEKLFYHRKRAPLVEFGIEEGLCGLYCQYNGLLAPSYETSCRDGCWMCHNQGVNQLRQLRKEYPQLWALLLKWDADSPVNFKANGHTVHDYDRRFQLEDEHFLVPGDPRFKWSMLDGDLQYRFF